MELQLFAVNLTRRRTNSGNLSHAMMHTSRERVLSISDHALEKLLMSVKEKLKTKPKLSNGHTMEIKIKSGLSNQYGDDL